jgi:hypothetical protein
LEGLYLPAPSSWPERKIILDPIGLEISMVNIKKKLGKDEIVLFKKNKIKIIKKTGKIK